MKVFSAECISAECIIECDRSHLMQFLDSVFSTVAEFKSLIAGFFTKFLAKSAKDVRSVLGVRSLMQKRLILNAR